MGKDLLLLLIFTKKGSDKSHQVLLRESIILNASGLSGFVNKLSGKERCLCGQCRAQYAEPCKSAGWWLRSVMSYMQIRIVVI